MSPRSLVVVFRRSPSADKQAGAIAMQGYALFWPDGRPVDVALNAFCMNGQRLLGLGKHLAGRDEKRVRLVCQSVTHREAEIVRVAGFRVRRLCLERQGFVGRLHFLDGTPTSATFNLHGDEPDVLAWIGLDTLADGDRQWLDIAAMGLEDDEAPAQDLSSWTQHLVSTSTSTS